MMFNLLIIEDEPIEREVLKLMIQTNCPVVAQIMEAENGFQAIDKCRSFLPDVVLVDINMPGINGLDTIRELKKMKEDLFFLILSSYNRFEYAQEAVKLGVEDFILKPVKIETLKNAFEQIGKKLESAKQSRTQNSLLLDRMESIRPIVESDCIFSLISRKADDELERIMAFLGFEVQSGFCLAVQYENTPRLILRKIKQALQDVGMKCIGEQFNNLLIFFILEDKQLEERKLTEVGRFTSMLLHEMGKDSCRIGVGNIYQDTMDLSESYKQALHALKQCAAGESFHIYGEHTAAICRLTPDIPGSAKDLLSQLKKNDRKELAALLSAVSTELILKSEDLRQAKERVYNLLVLLTGEIRQQYADVTLLMEFAVSLEEILSLKDTKELAFYLEMQLLTMQEGIQKFNRTNNHYLVEQAMMYISENYSHNITLDDMAANLRISPFYLSRVFKKTTGKNFTDVLAEKRIEAAKLLLHQKKSIKEVTYETGFNSQNYFSKIFKKYVGCSPREYRGDNNPSVK